MVVTDLFRLAGSVFRYGERVVRRKQYQRTGSVTAQGNTYYLPPEDKSITPVLLDWGVWERNETQEISQILHPGDTFIDVGANFGWYTVIGAKAVGATGRVIAFEPVPRNLEFLRRNVAANECNNTKIETMALSNKSGSVTIHLARDNLGGHTMIEMATGPDHSDKIEVRAMTLDEYLKADTGKIALIKIDAEGAEGYILEGMRETLQKHPDMVIFMEFTPGALGQAGFDPEAMLRRFHDQGYDIRHFNDDPGRLRRGWGWMRTSPLLESHFAAYIKDHKYDFPNLIIKKRANT
jgi:FkbM family methyltransferase